MRDDVRALVDALDCGSALDIGPFTPRDLMAIGRDNRHQRVARLTTAAEIQRRVFAGGGIAVDITDLCHCERSKAALVVTEWRLLPAGRGDRRHNRDQHETEFTDVFHNYLPFSPKWNHPGFGVWLLFYFKLDLFPFPRWGRTCRTKTHCEDAPESCRSFALHRGSRCSIVSPVEGCMDADRLFITRCTHEVSSVEALPAGIGKTPVVPNGRTAERKEV